MDSSGRAGSGGVAVQAVPIAEVGVLAVLDSRAPNWALFRTSRAFPVPLLAIGSGAASEIASGAVAPAVRPAQISAGPFQVILVVLAFPSAGGLLTALLRASGVSLVLVVLLGGESLKSGLASGSGFQAGLGRVSDWSTP